MHPLKGYLPSYAIFYVDELVKGYDVHFKVVSPRKTKLGDCRFPIHRKSQIIITINEDLKPFQFLITSIHELAHAKTYREYGNKVKAHGKEWKLNFSELLSELTSQKGASREDISIIQSIAQNPKATSFGSQSLQHYLKSDEDHFLKDLDDGITFNFNKKEFRKLKLLRTYVLCECLDNKRRYKIHGLAQIQR